jgi:hypothetical protein
MDGAKVTAGAKVAKATKAAKAASGTPHARLRGTALPRREGGYLASAERSTAADAALEVCLPDRPLFGARACVRACARGDAYACGTY